VVLTATVHRSLIRSPRALDPALLRIGSGLAIRHIFAACATSLSSQPQSLPGQEHGLLSALSRHTPAGRLHVRARLSVRTGLSPFVYLSPTIRTVGSAPSCASALSTASMMSLGSRCYVELRLRSSTRLWPAGCFLSIFFALVAFLRRLIVVESFVTWVPVPNLFA
jgi:hypothetical protein